MKYCLKQQTLLYPHPLAHAQALTHAHVCTHTPDKGLKPKRHVGQYITTIILQFVHFMIAIKISYLF